MDNAEATSEEYLVLSDQEGNYFAIPRDTVERYKVSKEKQSELESELGEDVIGYVMDNWYVRENLTAQYQAERRQEAARERLIRSGRGEEEPVAADGGQGAGGAQPTGLRGMLIGMFAVLRSFAPGTSK
jgi:hypothetical protein